MLARVVSLFRRRGYNIVRWREMKAGGHFAAMEEPQLFADDVREFYRSVR